MTMAERLAAAAAGNDTSSNNGQGATIPQVETVDSQTVAGSSKSGAR